MKTLYLVRHAKSSWKDSSLRDKDRPLNKRGKRDAPIMADYLANTIECPQVFISSPSRRTKDTAASFLQAFGKLATDLLIEEELFHGDEEDIEEVIQSIDENINSAMIFIHNPGITEYTNKLTGARIINVSTCGVAGIQLNIDHWKTLDQQSSELLFYYYPKGLDLRTQ